MTCDEVLEWFKSEASDEEREGLKRSGIPNERAFGIPMESLQKLAKQVGRSHELADELWKTRWYEARTLAVLVEEPVHVTPKQMDQWAHDFDSWAICDTACFHLFDRTAHAWEKTAEWTAAPQEFVRRAGYALVWALSLHDREATDDQFVGALSMIAAAEPDKRPLVKKAMDMALRATGKRNATLNRSAIAVAGTLAESGDRHRAWVGRRALKELTSKKMKARFGGPR